MAGNRREDRGMSCKVCGESFDTGQELDEHGRAEHPEEFDRPRDDPDPATRNEFVCPDCGEAFESDAELNQHRIDQHGES
jgi:hypothetical protein